MNNEVTCESSSEGYKNVESAHPAGKNEENKDEGDKWEYEKTEVDEGVVPDRDNNKNKTSLLSSTIKRGRLTTGERLSSQRRSKRRRFSLLFFLDDETKLNNESVINRYTPFKSYRVSILRPTSSRLSRFEGNISNTKMKLTGSGLSRRPIPKITVIYKR